MANAIISKAFKGLVISADFRKQACGCTFRAGGCRVCPHCRVYLPRLKRAKVAAPRSGPSLIDKAVAALCAASDGALSPIDARIAIERLLSDHRSPDLF